MSSKGWRTRGMSGVPVQDQMEVRVWFKSQTLKTEVAISKGRRRWNPNSRKQTEICHSSAILFYLNPQRLDDTHSYWWGWTFLLGLLIQIPISNRTVLKDTPTYNILPIVWSSLSLLKQGKLTESFSQLHTYTHLLRPYWQPSQLNT